MCKKAKLGVGGTPELVQAVTVPDALTWRSGRHAHVHPAPTNLGPGNHPFTTASVSQQRRQGDREAERARVPRTQAGFTHTLANMVERSCTTLPVTGPGTPTALASPVSPDLAATLDLDFKKAASDNCATSPLLAAPRVHAHAAALRTLINGPYGGHMRPLRYPWSVAGISAMLPWVLVPTHRMGTGLSQGGDDASASGMGLREMEWEWVKGWGWRRW